MIQLYEYMYIYIYQFTIQAFGTYVIQIVIRLVIHCLSLSIYLSFHGIPAQPSPAHLSFHLQIEDLGLAAASLRYEFLEEDLQHLHIFDHNEDQGMMGIY